MTRRPGDEVEVHLVARSSFLEKFRPDQRRSQGEVKSFVPDLPGPHPGGVDQGLQGDHPAGLGAGLGGEGDHGVVHLPDGGGDGDLHGHGQGEGVAGGDWPQCLGHGDGPAALHQAHVIAVGYAPRVGEGKGVGDPPGGGGEEGGAAGGDSQIVDGHDVEEDGAGHAPVPGGVLGLDEDRVAAWGPAGGVDLAGEGLGGAVEEAVIGGQGRDRSASPGGRVHRPSGRANTHRRLQTPTVAVIARPVPDPEQVHLLALKNGGRPQGKSDDFWAGGRGVGVESGFGGVAQGGQVGLKDAAFEAGAGLEEGAAHLEGEGGHPQIAVGPIGVGAVKGVETGGAAADLMAVVEAELATQGAQLAVVGRSPGAPIPGVEDQAAIAVQRDENARGVRGGGVRVRRAALVREEATQICLQGRGLRLGGRGSAPIEDAARVCGGAARAGATVPFVAAVAVEIHAIGGEGAGAGRVRVLAPGIALLGPHPPVRVGLGQDVDFAEIENGGDLRVHAIGVDQLFGKTGSRFRGHIFPGVDRAHDEEGGLGAGDGLVGENEYV